MQVKKFEARTMNEAIEMVKTQLGPDAIILAVRDNKKSFGLVGESSFEITAAASEETFHKKKFVESKLPNEEKEKFNRVPARIQKQIINKFVDQQMNKKTNSFTNKRYIDIIDDHSEDTKKTVPPTESTEIQSLKNEIKALKDVIFQFQNKAQTTGSYPGAVYGIKYELNFLFEKLIQTGVAEDLSAEILLNAQNSIAGGRIKNHSIVEAWVARSILNMTKVISENEPTILKKYHCFVGPSGSGKTSSMVKMASHLVIKEKKKIAILTTDTQKVGAIDQLKIYAQILNVPFMVIRTETDWLNLNRYSQGFDALLIDSSANALKTSADINHMKELLPPGNVNAAIHLVLSAKMKDRDLINFGNRYSNVGITDVIFTGLDEVAQHGSIFNFNQKLGWPLHSFGIGPRIPEDFEYASSERVLDLIFKITQMGKQNLEAI